jgi:hypothetical protein
MPLLCKLGASSLSNRIGLSRGGPCKYEGGELPRYLVHHMLFFFFFVCVCSLFSGSRERNRPVACYEVSFSALIPTLCGAPTRWGLVLGELFGIM